MIKVLFLLLFSYSEQSGPTSSSSCPGPSVQSQVFRRFAFPPCVSFLHFFVGIFAVCHLWISNHRDISFFCFAACSTIIRHPLPLPLEPKLSPLSLPNLSRLSPTLLPLSHPLQHRPIPNQLPPNPSELTLSQSTYRQNPRVRGRRAANVVARPICHVLPSVNLLRPRHRTTAADDH